MRRQTAQNLAQRLGIVLGGLRGQHDRARPNRKLSDACRASFDGLVAQPYYRFTLFSSQASQRFDGRLGVPVREEA